VQSKGPEKENLQEEWFFVNGICTGQQWMVENVNLLANIFGRPITGIHNKTFGIFRRSPRMSDPARLQLHDL
jgi:hypothetical protein